MRGQQKQFTSNAKSNSHLVQLARAAMDRALANSSRFKVGVALQAKNKKIYQGCNIETITSNLGICAERVALFKALSEGEREFTALAIVASSGQVCTPCGVCRQLLWEFAPGLKIVMMDRHGRTLEREIHDLLPFPFDRSALKKSTS
ncbi:MAG TPA: cytidine deaminase [Nitrospiria bacterium]|nr:cytidine deaminase [Nitrospiria bacterium]